MGKILVVDDMPDALLVIRATLENAEHEVIETGDPCAAVSLALKTSPDAIVLDVMMPGISGYEVMDGLRQQSATRKTPILMLSALAGTNDKVRGLRQGADDYVTKPFVPMELVARVESLIARQIQDSTGLQGSLGEHPFLEVVQGLEQNRKTGMMEITTPRHSGRVRLYGGKVVTAELSRLVGAEAVLAMLELSEGNFVFQAARSVKPVDNKGDLIPIHPLLLEASWIEDELRARDAHLPSPGQNLELVGELKAVPSELSGLPIREIAARLYLASEMAEKFHVASEITLASLLDAGIAAPNKVRLVVAWLLEQGIAAGVPPESGGKPSGEEDLFATRPAVDVAPGEVSEGIAREAEPDEGLPVEDEWEAADAADISESLDSAIREFFQEALFRDFSLDDVRLSILIDDSAWHSLIPLLLALPASLLGPAGRSARRLVLLDRSGRLALFHESGMLTLSVERVRPGRDMLSPRPDSAGIVLWLGAASSLSALATPIAEIRSGSSPGAGLLLISTVEAMRRQSRKKLREDPRWRVPANVPKSLEELLLGLCRTEAA